MDPILDNSTNPWDKRDEIGVLDAFIQTVKQVLSGPTQFFQLLKISPGYSGPLFYYFLIVIFVSMLGAAAHLVVPSPQFKSMGSFAIPFLLIISPLISIVGVFVNAAFCHLGVMLLKGERDYKATFDVVVYGSTPALLSFIPFVGGIIGGIWSMILTIIGFKEVHRMSIGKAVLAYFLVTLGFLVLFILLAVVFGAIGASQTPAETPFPGVTNGPAT